MAFKSPSLFMYLERCTFIVETKDRPKNNIIADETNNHTLRLSTKSYLIIGKLLANYK